MAALPPTKGNTFDDLACVFKELVDKPAPLCTRRTRQDTQMSWYNEDIHAGRLLRRKLERKWLTTRLKLGKQLYHQQRDVVVSMINQAKTQYYNETL